MVQTLKQFTDGAKLIGAISSLLSKLGIQVDRVTADTIKVKELYGGSMPKYLTDALQNIKDTYFVGVVNNKSLAGAKSNESSEETLRKADKYDGMFVFACDAAPNAKLTRTDASALTRAFNRIALANPVILIIRQNNLLTLSTCERTEYSQEWRRGSGEKLGKVTMLRDIDCKKTHRGHVDILESLGDKAYSTFDELYKHWMEIFSSELLTKKFYSELSDWYAWAVMVAKFPNYINPVVLSEKDKEELTEKEQQDKLNALQDQRTKTIEKCNHEACIRLITRLIFVWFIKQKHLIPDEFFDENYIRENLIKNFNPHVKSAEDYKSEDSKYYRLILQNLFFAMLNCPIVAEGKKTPNNRRFVRESFQGKNPDYNINNIMRYKKEFMPEGADKLLKLANDKVPFLNGGLFDCLDDKDSNVFYDGFSEEKKSLDRLFLPDYLFFGEEAGKGIDLSQWYDDIKKKNVSARGLIDILKRYSFTIEENTPYDQEVSLDPELLGKVFENLLAAYNPETKKSARKQTGSFYTPREIVQYMVDESLVAHLKRKCGDDMEPQYRQLLNYASDDIELTADQRKSIMNAIYNCRVLDPACGSGAFPMGVLQQMVHILKRIDPSNRMWEELVKDESVRAIKKAFEDNLKKKTATPEEKAEHDKQLEERTNDIESAFNQSINDPDYARKLYLIEHSIYGVDIQPIATQISKLRFFISLVVDQKPTKDAKTNFCIRPLPNLEAKFVTANTLIPLDRTKDLFTNTDEIRYYEELLQDINHRIFLAKKNTVKKELQQLMFSTRTAMAQTMENLGTIGSKGYNQLMEWNMFDQNASASFFDPDWMFGIKDGFDVVIANPPYVDYREIPQETLSTIKKYDCMFESQRPNFFIYFIEKGCKLLAENGCLTYINPLSSLSTDSAFGLRRYLLRNGRINWIVDVSRIKVFQEASTYVQMWNYSKLKNENDESNNFVSNYSIRISTGISLSEFSSALIQLPVEDIICTSKLLIPCNMNAFLLNKLEIGTVQLKNICKMKWGTSMSGYGRLKISSGDFSLLDNAEKTKYQPIIQTADIKSFYILWQKEYIPSSIYSNRIVQEFIKPKIVIGRLTKTIQAAFDERQYYVGKSTVLTDLSDYDYLFILGLLNSKLVNFWYSSKFDSTHMAGGYLRYDIPYLEQIPIKKRTDCMLYDGIIETTKIIANGNNQIYNELVIRLDTQVYHLYNLTYDEVLVIDPETPITREEYDNFILN